MGATRLFTESTEESDDVGSVFFVVRVLLWEKSVVSGESLEDTVQCKSVGGQVLSFVTGLQGAKQFLCRNKLLLKYGLQSTDTTFRKVCPVDREVFVTQ